MGPTIDLNCDMGESYGAYKMGADDELIKHITSASIACGFHAGDPTWMRYTVELAEAHGVAVGAHPGYPDLAGFGRRAMAASPNEVKNDMVYQLGALQAFTKSKRLQHVKPHGALYNRAVGDEPVARAICEAILEVDPDMVLLALAGSRWITIAQEMGLRVASEIFADRGLNSDGTLVSRTLPGALLDDAKQVAARSVRMVTEGKASTVSGEEIDVAATSLCMHSDSPGAIAMFSAVREELERANVAIRPLGELATTR